MLRLSHALRLGFFQKGFCLFVVFILSSDFRESWAEFPREAPTVSADSKVEVVYIPIRTKLGEEESRASGVGFEYYFPLPEHIFFRPGGAFMVKMDAPSKDQVAVFLNDRKVAVIPSLADGEVPLPESLFQYGWNRVTLRLLKVGRGGETRRIQLASSSAIRVAYERIPFFPEMQRFPQPFVEELLLRPDFEREYERDRNPIVSLLLPENLRDVHIRGCALLGARLGQLQYLTPHACAVRWLDSWKAKQSAGNRIVIGTREDLKGFPFPSEMQKPLEGLQPGQGFLAEFTGQAHGGGFRCFVISGGNDEGLEKALLTLNSHHSILASAQNPMVVNLFPVISPWIEAKAQDPAGEIFFHELTQGIKMKGPSVDEKTLGWRLPYRYELDSGCKLHLIFRHSAKLASNASLEVFNNGISLGSIPLKGSAEKAVSVSHVLALPKEVHGYDPMQLTFKAYLDPEPSAPMEPGGPWLTISNESKLVIRTRPLRFLGLEHLSRFLLEDNFLRRAVILIPRSSDLNGLQTLLNVSRSLGERVPSSSVLWIEALGYSKEHPLDARRLQGCDVLILGSSAQWREALPKGVKIPITQSEYFPDFVEVQGKRAPSSEFDVNLGIVQVIRSPWEPGRSVVLAGGWKDYSGARVQQCLTDQSLKALMFGEIFLLDSKGRMLSTFLNLHGSRPLLSQMRDSITFRSPTEGAGWIWKSIETERFRISSRNLVLVCLFLVFLSSAVWIQVVLVREKRRKRLERKK